MKTLAQVLCGALLCLGAMVQDHAAHVQTHPVTLVTGLGDLHHPVSTQQSAGAAVLRPGAALYLRL